MGRCIDVVDAAPEEVVAWLYDVCSRDRMRVHHEYGNIARLALNDDGRQLVFATIKHLQFPLTNREFVSQTFWWRDETGAYFYGSVSVNDVVDYGVSTKTVRGLTRALVKLIPWG